MTYHDTFLKGEPRGAAVTLALCKDGSEHATGCQKKCHVRDHDGDDVMLSI